MIAKVCGYAYISYHAPSTCLVSSIVIGGNEYWGRGQRQPGRERVVYGSVLHAFTFDLPIITIGFTVSDSVAKPIS